MTLIAMLCMRAMESIPEQNEQGLVSLNYSLIICHGNFRIPLSASDLA